MAADGERVTLAEEIRQRDEDGDAPRDGDYALGSTLRRECFGAQRMNDRHVSVEKDDVNMIGKFLFARAHSEQTTVGWKRPKLARLFLTMGAIFNVDDHDSYLVDLSSCQSKYQSSCLSKYLSTVCQV